MGLYSQARQRITNYPTDIKTKRLHNEHLMKRVLKQKFTLAESFQLYKAMLVRLCEITIEDLERDYPNADDLEELDELYLRAYLNELFDQVMASVKNGQLNCPPKTQDDFAKQLRLIGKHRPELAKIFELPSNFLKNDVDVRLQSFKRRVADQFENEFKETLDRYSITSPIEQIFLLEWNHRGIAQRYGVTLLPQATVESSIGNFDLDFLVHSADQKLDDFRIGIELDGHDFHEKTKEQVARDKRRERAIIYTGVTVLRFSGSEIVCRTRNCVQEIIDFLQLRRDGG